MGTKDPRIDVYIKRSEGFAQPILIHLRKLVHKACPDIEETMKWGFPHFMHRGILCSMASFKQHCAFGFWKGSLVLKKSGEHEGMGSFGKITSRSDLPADKILIGYIKKGVTLNEAGVKAPGRAKSGKAKRVNVPAFFLRTVRKNLKALNTFQNFSPSHKREYVEWVTEAKTAETRERRLRTAIEWISAGKPRNWKYTKK